MRGVTGTAVHEEEPRRGVRQLLTFVEDDGAKRAERCVPSLAVAEPRLDVRLRIPPPSWSARNSTDETANDARRSTSPRLARLA